jgi:methionine biosynthesis protein MetW
MRKPLAKPPKETVEGGSVAQYYDQYWSRSDWSPVRPIARGLRHVLAAHLSADSVDCLDVGCGDGQTIGLWIHARSRSYVGVDVSSSAVASARAAGLDAREVADAAALPFADSSFDVVVCLEVLEHLFEPHVAAAEALRVLRPGGVYIATVPNVAYWRWRRDLALRGRWNPFGDNESEDAPWRDPHIRFFTAAALARMLSRTGFETVDVGGHEGEIGAARVLPRIFRAHPPARRHLEQTLNDLLLRTLSLRLHAVATKATH